MTLFKWVIRSLVYYRRMHIAVALAAATATAALTGALFVGDSVKATLKHAFVSRLGKTGHVISAQERFFTEALSQRLENENIDSAPVLMVRGMVTKGDGTVRVNKVRVLGVDDRFFKLSPAGVSPKDFDHDTVLLNSALASRLKISKDSNSEAVLRFDNPSAISRNLVLAPNKDSTISVRLPVAGVLDDEHFGRFSLEANQQEPLNIFVPLAWLQKQIEKDGRANLLLINDPSLKLTEEDLKNSIAVQWRLEDAGARLENRKGGVLELLSSRVFIDPPLAGAAKKAAPESLGLLTYFVNELRVKDSFTPYSMVTAAERKGAFIDILPSGMKDDEIVINRWLADDLNAEVGDDLTLEYFVPGGWQSLEKAQKSFTVCSIVPLEGAAADSSLMPDLPGLSDSENCSDWDPSLPIDLDLIRDKDEKYWDDYRGTPKAFVTLAAGEAMWANVYGNLTAVRIPAEGYEKDKFAEKLTGTVEPSSVGLAAIPVREKGMTASRGGTDFGQLFLGLSMFLIFSAVLLMWLLFVFSVEGRRDQTGMLLATGFPAKKVRRLYLYEGLSVALLGSLAGTVIALVYTRILVWGLSNAWSGAVAGMSVLYSPSAQSLFTGFISGFLIALTAMIWTLRRQMKSSAHDLLSGTGSSRDSMKNLKGRKGWISRTLLILSFACAVLLIAAGRYLGSSAMAGSFFGAGALLLVSIMILIRILLIEMASNPHSSIGSLNSLSLHNSARKRGRSMAVIAMLACGVFMVVAVSANRKDPGEGSERRESGTGGFALYAESSVPVVQDLNSESGREKWGMEPSILKDTAFVSLRVRRGDDASCLNLNRAQEPRLLGVSVDELAERGAFSFQEIENSKYKEQPWNILKQDSGEGIVPAIGDYPTVYWGLGKSTGDILTYRNRRGEDIRIRIAGMIKSSILQGSLIISDDAMGKYFPEVEGYGAWLIDAPFERKREISEHITRRMANAGLSVETTVERLELFARMEETYLSIFLMLGGLGLMIGCIGLGLIVARNLIERQGELAMLRAVGFSRHTIMKMVCYEHIYLLLAGLFAGLVCAVVSVMPSISTAAGELPFGLIAVMTLLIGVSGIIWVVVSTKITLKGSILTSLRNE